MTELQLPSQVSREEMLRQREYAQRVRGLWSLRPGGRPPKAFVRTFGCQGNAADGEKIMGMLREMGYQSTGQAEEADLILFNTCAIRENAQSRLYGMVGELKRYKDHNPELVIGLCGCMMQQAAVVEKIQRSYRQVDLIFGTHVMHTLPQLLYQVLTQHKRVVDIAQAPARIAEGLPVQRGEGPCASLQIMYGCDNYCSYCIVPYVRGREVSRRPAYILEEARELLAQGYREILLLGQNVNSYGKGLPPQERITFPQLLEQLCGLEGEFRIRFMTSHPKDCTRELIDTMARNPKISRLLHLPVQSGSNRVLREMNRRYTREQYLELIGYAKEKIPGLALSSDIIVGFPGETREEFLETLSLVREVEYQMLYTFIYSPRPGTKAAQMDDPVPQKEKSAWMGELLAAQQEIADRINGSYLDRVVPVLVEHPSRQEPGMMVGRNDQGLPVRFAGGEELAGQFVPVRITATRRVELVGELAAVR